MPRGGDGDDGVDRLRGKARIAQGIACGIDEQGRRALQIGPAAIGPAARCTIPVDRHHRVAIVDGGIGEHGFEPRETGIAGRKHVSGDGQRIVLAEAVRRHRRGEAEDRGIGGTHQAPVRRVIDATCAD